MNNKPKTCDEIREAFLSFFEKNHQHTRIKSSSLVPNNPTILLTTAGMVQFIPYFLGIETPPYKPARATSCQKCARAGGKDSDIENVGRTPRHHTFFEMLGNFSFGDYFKEEIIPWSWDFVTNYLGLDKDRLWITIYENDDEAGEIWQKAGVPKERILKKGKKDNFWGPVGVSGSCGPCSEIHYDLGEHLKCSDDCSIATCECNRWVEIWNLVFTELFQDEKGNLQPLEKKNVDTGMGLERIAMVCQGVASTFETDLLRQILDEVCKISGKKYGENEKTDISLRIITDHTRCVSFLIADGVTPSNEGRGYVLRMILRRALRHGYMLGLELPFLKPIVDKVIAIYKDAYPELSEKSEKIHKTILQEEERFKLTLQRGYSLMEEIVKTAKTNGEKLISGENCFKLYDTYGFPLELTKEIAQESFMEVDEEAFKTLMAEQKERARASMQKVVLADDKNYTTHPATNFVGYTQNKAEASVLAIIKNGEEVDVTNEDDISDIILDTTPFYAESGGQIGDSGVLITEDSNTVDVLKTFKVQNVFAHRVKGAISKGTKVKAEIDVQKRAEIQKHHSLAHLLQAALIDTLGKEVHQAGSQVEENRTRYDFSFDRAMTKDEIAKTEALINSWINEGLNCKTEIMDIEEAKNSGAMALFGEKYGDKVRVVSFIDAKNGEKCCSKELCGGCHVLNSKDLRLAKIVSEGASSAGVRRIEILCSNSAFDYLTEKTARIDEIAHKYKLKTDEVAERLDKLTEENKAQNARIAELEAQIASSKFETLASKAQDVQVDGKAGKLFITLIEDHNPNALKFGLEMFAKKLGESVIVLCSKKPDNAGFVIAKVSDGFVKKGISAGDIVSKIMKETDGKGGGKAQMAQGSVKNITNIKDIFQKIEDEIKEKLK